MIKVSASPHNRGVIAKINGIVSGFDRARRQGFYQLGKDLRKTAQDGIKNPPKTGIAYKYKGRTIIASKAGEYPANRSGNLRRSVVFEVQGNDKLVFGAGADYAKFLEQGTSKMKKRPALEKSIQANKQGITRVVGDYIYRELTK